ncbi:capsid protein [robinz virus RP_369]|nr:capsid protein [robinz virus RP_369]
MAYRRRYGSSRARRPTARSRRSTTRRPYARKRRFTGRTTRRRVPTKKMMLNVTSKKKRDTMSTFTDTRGTDPTNPAATPVRAPILMRGGVANTEPYVFPWVCTARRALDQSGDNNPVDAATRGSSTCYMVGLSERIRIETSSSIPWLWRRICFTFKGLSLVNSGPVGGYYTDITNTGYVRTARALPTSTPKGTLYQQLFRGVGGGQDWQDPMYAAVDTLNVNLKFDKLKTINSQNDSGILRSTKRWHPMHKNLVYDDGEAGADENTVPLSTPSRMGMGDYYVVDFFRPSQTATTTDQLQIDFESTLYWHEK